MGCFYCVGQEYFSNCVSTCLVNTNLSPAYLDFAITGILLAFAFVGLSFLFKNSLRRSMGLKLLGITSFTTGLVTFGFIFNGLWVLKNIPLIVPAAGIGSYIASYFFSFYLLKVSYTAEPLKNKALTTYSKKMTKKLGIKNPVFYRFNSKGSHAFLVGGYKKAIFLSDNLIKKLDLKSLKTVILHELYHLKRNSTILKNIISSFGNLSFRVLPVPIEEFEQIEERKIDDIMKKRHGIDMNEIRKKLSETKNTKKK